MENSVRHTFLTHHYYGRGKSGKCESARPILTYVKAKDNTLLNQNSRVTAEQTIARETIFLSFFFFKYTRSNCRPHKDWFVLFPVVWESLCMLDEGPLLNYSLSPHEGLWVHLPYHHSFLLPLLLQIEPRSFCMQIIYSARELHSPPNSPTWVVWCDDKLWLREHVQLQCGQWAETIQHAREAAFGTDFLKFLWQIN